MTLCDPARDWHAAWFVAQTAGVVSIPPTDFYDESHWGLGENFLRLLVLVLTSTSLPSAHIEAIRRAFCKDPQMLKDASERLLKLKPYIRDA